MQRHLGFARHSDRMPHGGSGTPGGSVQRRSFGVNRRRWPSPARSSVNAAGSHQPRGRFPVRDSNWSRHPAIRPQECIARPAVAVGERRDASPSLRHSVNGPGAPGAGRPGRGEAGPLVHAWLKAATARLPPSAAREGGQLDIDQVAFAIRDPAHQGPGIRRRQAVCRKVRRQVSPFARSGTGSSVSKAEGGPTASSPQNETSRFHVEALSRFRR